MEKLLEFLGLREDVLKSNKINLVKRGKSKSYRKLQMKAVNIGLENIFKLLH